MVLSERRSFNMLLPRCVEQRWNVGVYNQWRIQGRGPGGPPPPFFWVKKEEITEGKKASRTRKSRPPPHFWEFKVALNPLRRIFLNFAKSCILSCWIQFNNKKWGSPSSFLSYKRSKLKLRVFLGCHIVAMVTYCATKIIPCSPVIGQLSDTMIVASIDKERKLWPIKIYVLESAGICFEPP